MRFAAVVLLLVWALSMASMAAPSTAEIKVKAGEFQRLRVVRGHFQGGEWNDEVDRWGCRKQEVMDWLREALGTGQYSASQIARLMGQPDAVAKPGDVLWEMARGRGSRLLVYHWRGAHDFLYFACEGERVLEARWWMAGE